MLQFEIQKLREAVLEERFLRDCARISLSHRLPIQQEFCGPGHFGFDAAGKLNFKAIVSPRIQFPNNPERRAGDLIPPDELFVLQAVDTRGFEWNASSVWPTSDDFDWTRKPDLDGSIVTGTLWEIHTRVEDDSGFDFYESVEIEIIDQIEIPCTNRTETTVEHVDPKQAAETNARLSSASLNWTGIQFGDVSIQLFNEPYGLRLSLSGAKLPVQFSSRVLESLQFILARTIEWTYSAHEHGGGVDIRIRQRPRRVVKRTAKKPIDFYGPFDISGSAWKMFSKFLEYISRDSRSHWHPISLFLHSIYEGAAASVDAERLAVSVAVEGILTCEFPELGATTTETRAAIQSLQSHFANWQGSGDCATDAIMLRRMPGLIALLARPSAKDRLRVLVTRGVITEEDVRAWDRLRNRAAHGDRSDALPRQEMSFLVNKVVTLLYKLIFYRIGFTGVYTDYGERGWPERTCTLVAPEVGASSSQGQC